jgi:hypothetical protein
MVHELKDTDRILDVFLMRSPTPLRDLELTAQPGLTL